MLLVFCVHCWCSFLVNNTVTNSNCSIAGALKPTRIANPRMSCHGVAKSFHFAVSAWMHHSPIGETVRFQAIHDRTSSKLNMFGIWIILFDLFLAPPKFGFFVCFECVLCVMFESISYFRIFVLNVWIPIDPIQLCSRINRSQKRTEKYGCESEPVENCVITGNGLSGLCGRDGEKKIYRVEHTFWCIYWLWDYFSDMVIDAMKQNLWKKFCERIRWFCRRLKHSKNSSRNSVHEASETKPKSTSASPCWDGIWIV